MRRTRVRRHARRTAHGRTTVAAHNRAFGNPTAGMKPSEKADEMALRRLRKNVRANPALADAYAKILRGEFPQWK